MIDLDLRLVRQLPIQALLMAALEDPEPGYRQRAAVWLGAHATRDALGALSRLADGDPDDDARLTASLAMRRIERRR